MNGAVHITLAWHDWLNLFGHYLLLSLMSLGGAISTTSEMHRFLVEQHGWLTQAQFNDSIALAQAAPGPNVLFIALMGWQVGVNSGSLLNALMGMAITMTGILLPSATLTYIASRWSHDNRDLRAVRAFKQGMAPVVVGLLIATGWVLAGGNQSSGVPAWHLWLLALGSGVVIWRTKIHLLWVLALGAVLGALGVV